MVVAVRVETSFSVTHFDGYEHYLGISRDVSH